MIHGLGTEASMHSGLSCVVIMNILEDVHSLQTEEGSSKEVLISSHAMPQPCGEVDCLIISS